MLLSALQHIFVGLKRTRDQKSTLLFQRVRLFLCSFGLYMPLIPYKHRRGTCVVECVAAHLRGFDEDSRSERTRDQKSTCSFVQYRPWIPGELRRGTCAVECVAAHLRGFEEESRLEVVFCIVEWSFEFGHHWLMLLMFLTAHLFQFRFVDSEQYCNMALRLRCRRHEFSVVRLLSPACHLFSCELWYATDDVYFFPMELDVKVAVRYQTSTHTTRWFPIHRQPFHRHPHLHAHALCSMSPLTGTSTYARKSWGGHSRCDLAPLTTSFRTVGQWERQHLAMAATSSLDVVGWAPPV